MIGIDLGQHAYDCCNSINQMKTHLMWMLILMLMIWNVDMIVCNNCMTVCTKQCHSWLKSFFLTQPPLLNFSSFIYNETFFFDIEYLLIHPTHSTNIDFLLTATSFNSTFRFSRFIYYSLLHCSYFLPNLLRFSRYNLVFHSTSTSLPLFYSYSIEGSWPAGIDTSFPKKTIYPGVLAFYKELDLGTEGEDEWDNSRLGNLVFLSARPHVYKDVSENVTYQKFRWLQETRGLHTSPSLLAGTYVRVCVKI